MQGKQMMELMCRWWRYDDDEDEDDDNDDDDDGGGDDDDDDDDDADAGADDDVMQVMQVMQVMMLRRGKNRQCKSWSWQQFFGKNPLHRLVEKKTTVH